MLETRPPNGTFSVRNLGSDHPEDYFWLDLLQYPFFFFFKRLYSFILERGRERGRKGETCQCEREMLISCLSYVP